MGNAVLVDPQGQTRLPVTGVHLSEAFNNALDMETTSRWREPQRHREIYSGVVPRSERATGACVPGRRRLNLQLYYDPERFTRKALDVWPTLPLLIQGHVSETTVDNVVAELEHSDLKSASCIISENQLWENIHEWLSPPDPSTNHNIPCETDHKKTATWFFDGNIYQEWKSKGLLIWIHGKSAPSLWFVHLWLHPPSIIDVSGQFHDH